MAWSESDIPSQDGRTALVTGSNAGLGLAIATALAAKGAKVLLACRNIEKAEAAAKHVRSVARAPVEIVPLDLASLASVAACAKQVLDSEDRLDLLINNAGLMAVDEAKTEDGFEMQIGVNHLGHFALTQQLLPLVLATPGSRILAMSSFGHRLCRRLDPDDLNFEERGYSRWPVYFQSKLANLLFSLELQRRLQAAGRSTIALTAHPGGSHTDLGTEGRGITNKLMAPFMHLGLPPATGALPMLRAATDPQAKGGEFYGPRLVQFGGAVKETPSRKARDVANAERLWAASERLTGISFGVPTASA
jgi:NAD(P)-dependent dehydrogenase (short-subunit alcohol dehydrogenase family)